MKLGVVCLSVVLAFATMLPVTAADSRQQGGFSSSPSRSSSPPPPSNSSNAPRSNSGTPRTAEPDTGKRTSGGFSSTPTAPRASNNADPTKQQRGSGGFSSSAASPTQRAAPSAVDRIAERSASKDAFRKFQQEQTKYKAPEIGTPATQQAARAAPVWRQYGNRWNSPDAYYARRSEALARNREFAHYYEQPPVWVTRPSYGGYAAAFLGGILLSHITEPAYASWAYSHRNDPDYQTWHEDMKREAADNAELRDKLAALDSQVADLQAKKAETSDALPPEVDPSLVVAPSTALIATSEESSGHPILWVISGAIAAVVIFILLCIYISQRRRRAFA